MPARAAPSVRGATSTAVYVYGVGWADAVRGGGSGVAGAQVEPLVHRSLAAITARVQTPVRARRRDLMLHSEVLQREFEAGTVLPFRFGTVFAGEDDVVDTLLEPRHDGLARRLRELEGAVELSVRAFYVEDAVLREIVANDPEIARLRDATRTASGGSANPLSVRLGEAVAAELAATRARNADRILATLLPLARDSVVEEPRADLEALRASFLVERKHVPEFDDRMNELARVHDGRIVFKYVGPLPPHSFVGDAGG